MLAETLLELGRHEEAILQVARAKTEDPGRWRAFYLLGRIHEDLRDYNRASDALTQCAFPSDKVTVPRSDRRDCLFAIAGMYVRTVRYARALEALDLLARPDAAIDLTADERDGLDLFRTLVTHQGGDISAAVALSRNNLLGERPSAWAAAYYAIFSSSADPVPLERLTALLTLGDVATYSPSFALIARLTLALQQGNRSELEPFVREALDKLYIRRQAPPHLSEATAADAMAELMRNIETDVAANFLGEVERTSHLLATLRNTPRIRVTLHHAPHSRWAHLEVIVPHPRGTRGLVLRVEPGREFKIGLGELRGRQVSEGLRLFVPVPLAPLTSVVSVWVETIFASEPVKLLTQTVTRPLPTTRLHALVVGAERYKAGLRSVPTALDDARRVAGALRDLAPSDEIALELLLGNRVEKQRIRDWILTDRRPDDILFLFLRGLTTLASTEGPGKLAFIPSDGSPTQPDTLIMYRELAEWLATARPANVIVVLDGDMTFQPGHVLPSFVALFGAYQRETRLDPPAGKNAFVITSRSTFSSAPVSREHGLSVMTIALIEGLNGLLSHDRARWDGRLWPGDVGQYIVEYFRRGTARRTVPLLSLASPTFSTSTPQPPLADQRRLLFTCEMLRRHQNADPAVTGPARQALRACRLTTRGEQWDARLDLLAVLLSGVDARDVVGVLKRWAARE
jgi:tetratricopeptide (TPR) repeat protein